MNKSIYKKGNILAIICEDLDLTLDTLIEVTYVNSKEGWFECEDLDDGGQYKYYFSDDDFELHEESKPPTESELLDLIKYNIEYDR